MTKGEYNLSMGNFVYILTNQSKRVLYVGVTSNLQKRLEQHRNNTNRNSFTTKYNVHNLIYYEQFSTIEEAIKREKQLKGWSRLKKLGLIASVNPYLNTIEPPEA